VQKPESNGRSVVLLSVKPKYAHAILSGAKTIELRRVRPSVDVPFQVLLYASSPQMAIVGTVRVNAISEWTPATLWRAHSADAGIDADAYRDYFDGAPRAFALHLSLPTPVVPIGLDQIRRAVPGFVVPQSYRYLSPSVVETLMGLADKAARPAA
jgi:predicted transcriptional regulator